LLSLAWTSDAPTRWPFPWRERRDTRATKDLYQQIAALIKKVAP
jgi:hypothetical protein